VISVGTELCLGLIQDTNASFLARRLAALGLSVGALSVVPDDPEAISRTLAAAMARNDLVVVTGGLGPTADDVTREAIAAAAGRPLERNVASQARLEGFFRKRGRPPTESNLQQADFPVGAVIFPNACGTADGFALSGDGRLVVAMPGVPSEMRAMYDSVEAFVKGALAESSGVVATRLVRTFGLPESVVGERLAELMAPGLNPETGLLASGGTVSVRLTARAAAVEDAGGMLDAAETEVRRRLGANVFGCGDTTLAGAVGQLLIERGLTAAVAESCTGGLIADMLTDVSGISAAFLAGYVCYSNEAKTELLNVPPDLIARHGAVSEEVARAMALGAARRSRADIAVAVTGIAGPTGATPGKPVGLAYIALAGGGDVEVQKHVFAPPRRVVKERAARVALNMMRLRILSDRIGSAVVAL